MRSGVWSSRAIIETHGAGRVADVHSPGSASIDDLAAREMDRDVEEARRFDQLAVENSRSTASAPRSIANPVAQVVKRFREQEFRQRTSDQIRRP